MLKISYAAVTLSTQEAPYSSGVVAMVDVKPLAAFGWQAADRAFAVLFGEHFVVCPDRKADPPSQMPIGLLLSILLSPLAVVGRMFCGVVAVSRNDGLLLAVLAPVLQPILSAVVRVIILYGFGLAALLTQFLGRRLVRRWLGMFVAPPCMHIRSRAGNAPATETVTMTGVPIKFGNWFDQVACNA